MNREVTDRWPDALGAAGTVIRYGHRGRALLVFPSERELGLWGFDVPHGWPSWRAQLARHMPRFR